MRFLRVPSEGSLLFLALGFREDIFDGALFAHKVDLKRDEGAEVSHALMVTIKALAESQRSGWNNGEKRFPDP